MILDENAWILSAGLTPDWKAVMRRRLKEVLARLPKIAAAYRRGAPASLRRSRCIDGLEYFLKDRSPARDRLACHPALDYWLYLWDKHFGEPCGEDNWRLQFGLFQGFPASLALSSGGRARLDCILDPDAHLHFYGVPVSLEFPKALALKFADVRLGPSVAEFRCEGGETFKIARAELTAGPAGRRAFGRVVRRRWPLIGPSMTAQSCGFLMTQGVVMHGLAAPTAKEEERFADVLRTALRHVEERDPALFAEMSDLVLALIPLVNPVKHGSVSSSYVNLRGAIALSHSDDPLLQAETLIHEFCHQKMNQLLLVDPILLPGQAGQVFHSPWRPDARRLRGLILGAHAFLNVAAYLLKSLSREEYELRARVAVMTNAARRLFEVDEALRTACAYGGYTEFGRRFVLALWRETQNLFHAAQWFPPALIEEARAAAAAHRAEFALPLTGIYRTKGFEAKVLPVVFGQPAPERKS